MAQDLMERYSRLIVDSDYIDPARVEEYDVKRGLRDKNGKGVLAGVTTISSVVGVREENGARIPVDGELCYRGYNVRDLVAGAVSRFSADGSADLYEETAFLLLFGKLPTKAELEEFRRTLVSFRTLPSNFTRDVIMKAPTKDLMNSLTKSVLTLQSYDDTVGDHSLETQLQQCLRLIAVFPMLVIYAYHAFNYSVNGGNMYITRPEPDFSVGENILHMLRPDGVFTPLEASVLDIALMLHMEHGGGNNSTFTTRVVTSAGSDTYAVIAAALCSLKGPKHGGANIKVMEMMQNIRENVTDTSDRDALREYLDKMLAGEVFDRKKLIYGMGHAVYSLSDPRAVVFKSFVQELAEKKGREADFALYRSVEELATELIPQKRRIYKGVCCNVDFYSGFVYDMLGIPQELFTPLFAIARIVGWSAHRMEELVNGDKIIRPSYQSMVEKHDYVPLAER